MDKEAIDRIRLYLKNAPWLTQQNTQSEIGALTSTISSIRKYVEKHDDYSPLLIAFPGGDEDYAWCIYEDLTSGLSQLVYIINRDKPIFVSNSNDVREVADLPIFFLRNKLIYHPKFNLYTAVVSLFTVSYYTHFSFIFAQDEDSAQVFMTYIKAKNVERVRGKIKILTDTPRGLNTQIEEVKNIIGSSDVLLGQTIKSDIFRSVE